MRICRQRSSQVCILFVSSSLLFFYSRPYVCVCVCRLVRISKAEDFKTIRVWTVCNRCLLAKVTHFYSLYGSTKSPWSSAADSGQSSAKALEKHRANFYFELLTSLLQRLPRICYTWPHRKTRYRLTVTYYDFIYRYCEIFYNERNENGERKNEYYPLF